MLSLFRFARKSLSFTAAVAALSLLPCAGARASTVDYTLTGTATGLLNGSAVGSTNFTITLAEDPSTINNLGGGYYRYDNVDATILTTAGSVVLTNVFLETNGNAGYQNIDLYDSAFTNGIGLGGSPALLGYDLATSVDTGVVTGAGLTPTLGSSSFSIQGGGTLQFTGLSSLEFQSIAPTPEPSTLLLLASGFPGLVALRRRFVS